MANRSADWLAQAEQDLAQAQLSAAHGHHEWACFAAHQSVEKALKGFHLSLGQQVWGHGLGRLFRDLPDDRQETMEATLPDLVERLRILDALYIPTRYPDSLPDGAPSDHFGHLQSRDALSHARALVDAITAQMA
jgi:HEPN domain-containing protein